MAGNTCNAVDRTENNRNYNALIAGRSAQPVCIFEQDNLVTTVHEKQEYAHAYVLHGFSYLRDIDKIK